MNQREIRAASLEQKRIEFLTSLAAYLDGLFDAQPNLVELRLNAIQLIRLIRDAGLPVWTYSNRQICKVVGDALRCGKILSGVNDYYANEGYSGVVIFQRKT